MASHSHPRRRSQKATGSQMTPSGSSFPMSLRKSGTFNAGKSVSSDVVEPFSNLAFAPKRSPTSPQALGELLNGAAPVEQGLIADRKAKVAQLLKSFDDTVAGRTTPSGDASILKEEDVLPVPDFMVQRATIEPNEMDIDTKPVVTEHHDADSGLGSSVSSTRTECQGGLRSNTRRTVVSSISTSHSAITKSHSSMGSQPQRTHLLSDHAVRHIKKHIITPILKEQSLKEFHPLIKDIPRRIGDRYITNLRDLEKTLFFLAPDIAKTPKSFLHFCERSIHCIITTVDYLCERDQRLPTDRPYTNNYFIDLVDQIRRYAQIMAATREKQAKGEALDEMDYSPDEELALKGGLSVDGKPAQLVRKKDGKEIPISEGQEVEFKSPSKRALSDDEDVDVDDPHRSMARRRKSDKAGDVMHRCRDCSKEFKRPCDLTKHEKTHSRPWKCPEAKCKYHDMGWPTEKERDRHVNDKHSAAPAMYRCLFKPCPYSSKRESNCKQHMEKAHGWEYVRSKSNGRKKSGASAATTGSANRTPSTPLTPYIATPNSGMANLSTPLTPFAPSPSVHNFDVGAFDSFTPALSAAGFDYGQRRPSATTDDSGMTFSSTHSPDVPSFVDEALTPDDLDFNHHMDMTFGNTGGMGFTAPTYQQPTPAMSTYNDFHDFGSLPPLNTQFGGSANAHHLSPGAVDATLFSPQLNDNMQLDEGFDETLVVPSGDFQLFDNSNAPSDLIAPSGAEFFGEFYNVGGQFDANFGTLDAAGFDPSIPFCQQN